MSDDQLKRRIYAVDLLRGVVMMLMLLDHTRDFVHAGALQTDPTDPATTTIPIFFTRWITHFCAPTFVFLSGVSIYLQKMNGKTTGELSRFLLTRGLWLIFLEFTLVRFGFVFNLDYSLLGVAQVIWVIGVSMVIMAGIVYVPVRVAGIFGVLMIAFHNLLDGIQVPPNIAFGSTPPPDLSQITWLVLHQGGVVPLFGGASVVFIAYPLIPWIGVMATGYAMGVIYGWEAGRRRKLLYTVGGVAVTLFIVIRLINLYGDPAPWAPQGGDAATFLSFLNTTKYPPSLLFIMMTLGPSLLVLALTDRIDGKALWQRISITFGRVPMFYYLLQMPVAHAFGIVLSLLTGKGIAYLFLNFPQNGQSAPPGHGFSLGVVYLSWIGGLVLLYPLCAWWNGYKQRHKHWLLSYL